MEQPEQGKPLAQGQNRGWTGDDAAALLAPLTLWRIEDCQNPQLLDGPFSGNMMPPDWLVGKIAVVPIVQQQFSFQAGRPPLLELFHRALGLEAVLWLLQGNPGQKLTGQKLTGQKLTGQKLTHFLTDPDKSSPGENFMLVLTGVRTT